MKISNTYTFLSLLIISLGVLFMSFTKNIPKNETQTCYGPSVTTKELNNVVCSGIINADHICFDNYLFHKKEVVVYFSPRGVIINLAREATKDNNAQPHSSDIEIKIKALIVHDLGVDIVKVKNDAIFTTDLGADDLDLVELIMHVEKEFNVSISDDKAEKIKTVGQLINCVKELKKP